MNGLDTIVTRNQQAVRDGVIEAGTAVGTEGIKPQAIAITRKSDGVVVEIVPSLSACAAYRSTQDQYDFVPTNGIDTIP